MLNSISSLRSKAESSEEKEQEDLVTSTVRPEEIPPIPENRFLMRRSPQAAQNPKEEAQKEQRHREERPRDKCVYFICLWYMNGMG